MPWSNFPTLEQRTLEALYGEDRPYHNAQHAAHVYAYSKEIFRKYVSADKVTSDLRDLAFRLAAAWHDVVYIPGWNMNEKYSAERFKQFQERYYPTSDNQNYVISEVYSMIMATKDHWNAENDKLSVTAKCFLDADIFELAAPHAIFTQNSYKLFKEFGFEGRADTTLLPNNSKDDELIEKRVKWLKSVLNRDHIFWVATDLDQYARENIENSIASLSFWLK